jgi:amidase
VALIERRNPALNAVADVARPPVRDAEATGDFVGVPFAVKELLGVPGLPWTMGSRLMAANHAVPPSAYVDRLLASGLRIVCSTTSSEFGLLGSTETALRGVTRNPWGAGLSAGGSSGGSAALVAARIVPMAHANDAGGSIRFPASMVGLFGFMPSAGRCEPTGPDAGGLAALVVDHCISRSVRDSAALLAATERRGSNTRFDPIGGVTAPRDERLRVAAVSTTLLGARPHGQVADALDDAVELLDGLGHRMVDVPLPDIDGEALSEAFFTTAALTMVQMSDMVTPMLGRPPGADELEAFTLELIEWGRTLPSDAGNHADAVLLAAGQSYLRAFEHCDVVVSPTVTQPPWPIGTLAPDLGRRALVERTEQIVGYTPIHNAAGCPAMSVPLHWNAELPIGIHFAARPGDDARLLALAHELEQARPWAHRRPVSTSTAG